MEISIKEINDDIKEEISLAIMKDLNINEPEFKVLMSDIFILEEEARQLKVQL